MPEVHRLRVSREIFLMAFGAELGAVEPWVTDRLTSLLEDEDACSGETLYSAGDPADYFYFLRKGHAMLVREGGAPQTVQGPGVLGMFDAFLDRPRLRSAV